MDDEGDWAPRSLQPRRAAARRGGGPAAVTSCSSDGGDAGGHFLPPHLLLERVSIKQAAYGRPVSGRGRAGRVLGGRGGRGGGGRRRPSMPPATATPALPPPPPPRHPGVPIIPLTPPIPTKCRQGSVIEGRGRKLTGADAARFRSGVLRQTGFLEGAASGFRVLDG